MANFAMASGKLIDVGKFTEDDVDLDDIAHHLSKIQRFNGALPIDKTYSVAEHCINLVQYAILKGGVSTLGLRMLLVHDASEAYLSDVVSPAKGYIAGYSRLENHIQRIVNTKLFHVDELMDASPGLKEMDKRILIDEVEHIKPHLVDLYGRESGLEKLGCHIHYNNHPATVKKCFLALAKELRICQL